MAEKSPKQPRFKDKSKATKAPRIATFDLPDGSRLSKKIPASVKIAIADAVMAFSEMEHSAESLIWDFTGLSIDDGKLLTKIDAGNKLELAKKLSERYGMPVHPHPQTTADIWMVVRQLVEARNKIAHGVWNMLDKKVPLAVSYRIPTSLGRVMGEHFPKDRLKLISSNCWKIKRLFDAMSRRIASSPTRPKAQSATPPPSYPEYPLPTDE